MLPHKNLFKIVFCLFFSMFLVVHPGLTFDEDLQSSKTQQTKAKSSSSQNNEEPRICFLENLKKNFSKDRREVNRNEHLYTKRSLETWLQWNSSTSKKIKNTLKGLNNDSKESQKTVRFQKFLQSIDGHRTLTNEEKGTLEKLGIFTHEIPLKQEAPAKSSLSLGGFSFKKLFYMSFLGLSLAREYHECIIPEGSYKLTCHSINAIAIQPQIPDGPIFCKYDLTCTNLNNKPQSNTFFLQKGLEYCLTESAENCDGHIVLRPYSQRLCIDVKTAQQEGNQIKNKQLSYTKIDCSAPQNLPTGCTVSGTPYVSSNSQVPALCQYDMSCSTVLSQEIEGTPKTTIQQKIISSKTVFLPSNAKGCLDGSISQLHETLSTKANTHCPPCPPCSSQKESTISTPPSEIDSIAREYNYRGCMNPLTQEHLGSGLPRGEYCFKQYKPK